MAEQQVVLISGGTSGIGLATARELLAQGAQVMLMGRDETRGAAALRKLGSVQAAFVAGDVSQPEACQRAVQQTLTCFGQLTGLVCSAGIYCEGALETVTPAQLDAVLATNVKGTMYLCQAALPELYRMRGSIVNVASDAGVQGTTAVRPTARARALWSCSRGHWHWRRLIVACASMPSRPAIS